MAREGEETVKEKEGNERKSTEVGAVWKGTGGEEGEKGKEGKWGEWKGAYKSEPVVYSTQLNSTSIYGLRGPIHKISYNNLTIILR